jgi:hypothetical protein
MVPNISRNGQSFRGAGAYHLHDKPSTVHPRPRTSERVVFTAARNLANADPYAALDEMWRTAEDAAHLKLRAGHVLTGRKNVLPVKTVSLAWAPGQSPTREEMCAAADSFLKAMGWGEHQALYIAHSDTAHAHLHIILNRVHPDTGRTLNDWQERKCAQRWALDYEREQGAVLCPERAARHKARAHRKKSHTGLPYRQAKLFGKHHAAASRARIAKDIRAAFRPAWAAYYRRQRAALHRFDRDRRSTERVAATLTRAGNAPGALKALDGLEDCRNILLQTFRLERATIACAQHAAVQSRVLEPALSPAMATAKGLPAAPFFASHTAPAKHVDLLQARHIHAPPASSSSFRFAAIRTGARSVFAVLPLRSGRHQLLALQVAAREQTRPQRSAPVHAAARARAEIAVAFAHRWGAIHRLPPEERAAAAAALQSEQAAALAARTTEVLGELHDQQRTRRRQFLGHLAIQRAALFAAHRDARPGFGAAVQVRRRFFASGRRATLTR